MSEKAIRGVVAIFHDEQAMEQALMALESAGIDRDDISLLASCATIEAKLRHRFRSVSELEGRLNTPRLAYVPSGEEKQFQHTLIGALTYVAASFGFILASSTGLAQMLIAATAAGGAVVSVGEALTWLVGHRHARRVEEQLNCGGLLIWVRVGSEAQTQAVIRMLKERGGNDVHMRGSDQLVENNALQDS